uniref:ZP domain-containing protein n=1 Tax=Mesocestoides corti TaxID=53468 RepID=A0A5K3G1W0_MESCO
MKTASAGLENTLLVEDCGKGTTILLVINIGDWKSICGTPCPVNKRKPKANYFKMDFIGPQHCHSVPNNTKAMVHPKSTARLNTFKSGGESVPTTWLFNIEQCNYTERGQHDERIRWQLIYNSSDVLFARQTNLPSWTNSTRLDA